MIVTDGELRVLIEREKLLTDYDPPNEWDGKDSLVQSCSIDLHIGAVFQPGIKPGKAGSAENPKSQLVLRTGQTAIVTTKESIHLPANYAGYGFPPSHVSSKALLMTNPGHIDPGYSGRLQFTVINMGREDYVLRSSDLIVTILIFKLSTEVKADYAARHLKAPGNPITDAQKPAASVNGLISKFAAKVSAYFAPSAAHVSAIAQEDIDRLSPDFVDVQKRATSIARKTLGYSTVGASVLAILLSWGVNVAEARFGGLSKMEARLTQVEASNNSLVKELQSTKEQLAKQIDVDNRLTKLELESKTKGAPK